MGESSETEHRRQCEDHRFMPSLKYRDPDESEQAKDDQTSEENAKYNHIPGVETP
jgi:hypothetical protein